jgi:hypothetical protein
VKSGVVIAIARKQRKIGVGFVGDGKSSFAVQLSRHSRNAAFRGEKAYKRGFQAFPIAKIKPE